MAAVESTGISCYSWREVLRSGRPEHIHPIIDPEQKSKRFEQRLANENQHLHGSAWSRFANKEHQCFERKQCFKRRPYRFQSYRCPRANSSPPKETRKKNLTQSVNTLQIDSTSLSIPNLSMDWENFQNLEEWVMTQGDHQPVIQETMSHGGVDELFIQTNNRQNEPTLVVQSSNSNSPTITYLPTAAASPLAVVTSDDYYGEKLSWPMLEILNENSTISPTSVLSMRNNNSDNTNNNTTPPLCDDNMQNELSNFNNDTLVKGIISSNCNNKNIDNIYDEYDTNTVVYNNSNSNNNLDLENKYWNKIGLKSMTNDVMFPTQGIQISNPVNNTGHKNIYNQTSNQIVASSSASFVPVIDNSNSVSNRIAVSRPSLQLDLVSTPAQNQLLINTPDVINTVLSMKKGDFDLLSYINDDAEDGSTVSNDITVSHSAKTAIIKPQKRSYQIDDNDDYNDQPAKKLKLKTAEPSVVATRRGRPPKPKSRTSSFSSEDTDCSKYRELRDKNNEASRRSRINRKLREANMEREAADLERENIKLTARVVELDRLVSRMRDALMASVLKK